MSITVVLMQMVKLFLVMCLGFVLYKVGIIDNHTKQQVTKFVLYVTTPALIIHSFVQNLGADGGSGMLGILFAVAIGMYVLLPMVALVFNKILMVNKKDRGIYMFMTVFSNVEHINTGIIRTNCNTYRIFLNKVVVIFVLGNSTHYTIQVSIYQSVFCPTLNNKRYSDFFIFFELSLDSRTST